MAGGWAGSNRRQQLPPDWPAIRRRILQRDGHQCTALMGDGTRCPERARDVDHLGDRHDHRDENLTSKCGWHHGRKSSAEGNAARRRWSSRRKSEPHPGLKE